jgi:hypothetical protein
VILFSIVRDRDNSKLMSIKAFGRGYLLKTGIYIDRVGSTRNYTKNRRCMKLVG